MNESGEHVSLRCLLLFDYLMTLFQPHVIYSSNEIQRPPIIFVSGGSRQRPGR